MACGGVHEPPGRTTRQLIDWAIDLWPYINGKALMSGINLNKMEGSDMLDVLHFLFEEDSHYTSEESAKSRSALRVVIYPSFYGSAYKYEWKDTKSKQFASTQYIDDDLSVMDEAEAVKPFNPREMQAERKPTMGAETITQFDPTAANPFSGILDAPVGH